MEALSCDQSVYREQLQFKDWLVQQISSGKYKGLEWIDGDKKRIFKIPWTKKNYPNWQEHHGIFKAWAKYRGKLKSETLQTDQQIRVLKSNFRTILRKCSELEELKNFHQLWFQTGNYKVYKVLTKHKVEIKKSRVKSNQEPLSTANKQIDYMKIPSEGGIQLPQCNRPQRQTSTVNSSTIVLLDFEQPQTRIKQKNSFEPISPKLNIRRMSPAPTTVFNDHDAQEDVFDSELHVSKPTAIPDLIAASGLSRDLPNDVLENAHANNDNHEEFLSNLISAFKTASDPFMHAVNESCRSVSPGLEMIDASDKNLPIEQGLKYDAEMTDSSNIIW